MSGKHSAVTVRPRKRMVAALSVVVTVAATMYVVQETSAGAATKGDVRLLVQAKAGVTKSVRQAVVAHNGGTLVRDYAAVRTDVVSVPAGEAASLLKRYQS